MYEINLLNDSIQNTWLMGVCECMQRNNVPNVNQDNSLVMPLMVHLYIHLHIQQYICSSTKTFIHMHSCKILYMITIYWGVCSYSFLGFRKKNVTFFYHNFNLFRKFVLDKHSEYSMLSKHIRNVFIY